MDLYQDRETYRKLMQAKDLVFYRITYRETDLFVGSKTELRQPILASVENFRLKLDEYIENNPKFHSSLIPIGYNMGTDEMIAQMCDAAKKAEVGPMATVAGAFCQVVFEAVQDKTDTLIVENGGDLLVWSSTPRTVALYAGDSSLSMKLGLKVNSADTPLGICASAGTLGHSLSFGKADMALCVSRDVLLADACATRLGNAVKGPEDVKPAVEEILQVEGIMGAVAIIGNTVGAAGDIELCPIDKSL